MSWTHAADLHAIAEALRGLGLIETDDPDGFGYWVHGYGENLRRPTYAQQTAIRAVESATAALGAPPLTFHLHRGRLITFGPIRPRGARRA